MRRTEDTLSSGLMLQLLWLHSSDRNLPFSLVYERNLDFYSSVCFTPIFGNWWPEGGASFLRFLCEARKDSEGYLRSPMKRRLHSQMNLFAIWKELHVLFPLLKNLILWKLNVPYTSRWIVGHSLDIAGFRNLKINDIWKCMCSM